MSTRLDGRSADALRPLRIETKVQRNPEGSVMISAGGTRILVAASIDEGVPTWMRGKGKGWLTAEYAMHPSATPHRQDRDGRRGKIDGRTTEIQRLIGRALRAAVDFEKLGERQIVIDCDVLDADGGTRTASINGALVAVVDALNRVPNLGVPVNVVVTDSVAAISVGLCDGEERLDLEYVEDRDADVDLNLVMTGSGKLIEVQGTGEEATFSRAQLTALLDLGEAGIRAITAAQKQTLGPGWPF